MSTKLDSLSPALRAKIKQGERSWPFYEKSPITNFLVNTKRHCNGGKTIDAGLWLSSFCNNGGKIFLSMSGAGSSFQQGITISELIRKNKIAGISVTGANLEESLYRLVAHHNYAYIPDYVELTREEEKELDHAGLRRITDTFLPEEESVRILLPLFEKHWRKAQEDNAPRFWHEYFFAVLEDLLADKHYDYLQDCWLYWAMVHNVEIVVGGVEDSTMGNIFAYYCYGDKGLPLNTLAQQVLKPHAQTEPIKAEVVNHSFRYMHHLAEWYLNTTANISLAFLQLGGGIAGDFPICVVPHLKKDFLADYSVKEQEQAIKPWAGFIEIHSSPMSYGSYSGAGGKEKITWSKLETDSFMCQIYGDYTEHFPDIAAIVLGW